MGSEEDDLLWHDYDEKTNPSKSDSESDPYDDVTDELCVR